MKLLDGYSLTAAESIEQTDIDRLARIRIPKSREWAEHHADDVRAGLTYLSRIAHDGRTIGSMLWRIEPDVERELVVMSVAAEPGYSITAFLASAVESLVIANRCESARFHTIRPALVRFVQSRGWHTAEIVMRKEYHG